MDDNRFGLSKLFLNNFFHVRYNFFKAICIIGFVLSLVDTSAQKAFKIKDAVQAQLSYFPLNDVRLLPSPFKNAMDMDGAYLLALEPDRFQLEKEKPNAFFDATYNIPEELVLNKKTITIKFQARPGSIAGGLFGAV